MKNAITPEILSALKDGDPKAFETVFISNFNKVEVFIGQLIKSGEDAGELAEEIFFHLWLHHSTLNPSRSFSTFISNIARNAAFNYLKHAYVKENSSSADISPDETGTPENVPFSGEMLLLVEMLVSKMPTQRQKIFRLSRMQGLSYDDAAEKLQIARKTVENQLSLAIRDLRGVLDLTDPKKEIIEEYLRDSYPRETEAKVQNWLIDEENREQKIEILSTYWNELQVEPDIFIYEALERVKARIEELSVELSDEEIPEVEPVVPQPEEVKPSTPLIQLSPVEVEPIDVYEAPLIIEEQEKEEEKETAVVQKEEIIETSISEPESEPMVIRLEDASPEKTEEKIVAVEKTPVQREQKSPVWFTDTPFIDEKKGKSFPWGGVGGLLIVLILLFIGGYVYFNQSVSQPQATILTVNVPQNEKSRLMLPDGTTVWLNATSSLNYPDQFIDDEHRIDLKGEAFFEIGNEVATPLKIYTSGLITNITAGSVNIAAYPEVEEITITPAPGARIEIESLSGEFYTLPDSSMFIWSRHTGDSIRMIGDTPLAPWKDN